MTDQPSPHDRIDKMAEVFKQLDARVAAVEQRASQVTAANVPVNIDLLLQQLAELQTGYDALPLNLHTARMELVELKMQASAAADTVRELEDGFMLDVSMELDERGKPVFSNDTLRKAEVARRCATSATYKEAIAAQRRADAIAANKASEAELLQDEMSSYRNRVRVTTQAAALVVALLTVQ